MYTFFLIYPQQTKSMKCSKKDLFILMNEFEQHHRTEQGDHAT